MGQAAVGKEDSEERRSKKRRLAELVAACGEHAAQLEQMDSSSSDYIDKLQEGIKVSSTRSFSLRKEALSVGGKASGGKVDRQLGYGT